jgi:hypothetical protein
MFTNAPRLVSATALATTTAVPGPTAERIAELPLADNVNTLLFDEDQVTAVEMFPVTLTLALIEAV